MKIHDKFFREVFLLDNTRSEMFYSGGYAMYSSCYRSLFFLYSNILKYCLGVYQIVELFYVCTTFYLYEQC